MEKDNEHQINKTGGFRPEDMNDLASFVTAQEGYQNLLIDPEKAAKLIDQAVEEQPDDTHIQRMKIDQLASSGQLDEAIKLAEELVRIEPTAENHLTLAHIYTFKKKLDLAQEQVEIAMELSSRSYFSLLMLAEILRKRKKYQQAIDITEELPNPSFKSEIIKAYCHMHLGSIEESYNAFCSAEVFTQRMDNTGPFDSRIRLYTGFIFLYSKTKTDADLPEGMAEKVRQAAKWISGLDKRKIGRFQKHDYQQAMNLIRKTFADGILILPDEIAQPGNVKERTVKEKRIYAKHPSDKNVMDMRLTTGQPEVVRRKTSVPNGQATKYEAIAKLADMKAQAKALTKTSPDNALQIAEQILAKNPDDEQAFYTKARSLMNLGKWDQALETAEEMIDASQTDRGLSIGYTLLVQILYQNKEFNEAEEAAQEGVIVCNNASNYYWLAIVLIARNKLDQAQTAAEKALKLKRNDRNLGLMAQVTFKQQMYESAFDYLEMIHNPNTYQQTLHANCSIKLGQLENAFRVLKDVEAELQREGIRPLGALIELRSAYIFLYVELIRKKKKLIPGLISKVNQAKRWLRELDNERVPHQHRLQYLMAIRQIRQYCK